MSTPKVVQEGDRIALKTTAGFYLNCWDSSGDVRAKTWEPTDAVERHEVFTIKKLPGQRSGSVYYGERICLTTSKGICITCVNRVGNVEAKQGDR